MAINGLTIMVLILVLGMGFIPLIFKAMVLGKIYVTFIEDTGDFNGKLKRPKFGNEYIVDGDGAYKIVSASMGTTKLPKGFPFILQVTVPGMIVRRDDGIPVSFMNPLIKDVSAREIKAALEPHHLQALVATSREGIEETKLKQMAPLLTLALVAMCLLMVFVVFTKVGALEKVIQALP